MYNMDDIDWLGILKLMDNMEKNNVSPSFESLEPRIIRQDDPRVSLRGQNALYVKHGHFLPRGTVIGPYISIVWDEGEHDTDLPEKLERERFNYSFEPILRGQDKKAEKVLKMCGPEVAKLNLVGKYCGYNLRTFIVNFIGC
eukprot:m.143703 g.143703  ORF g.143703 m.143703 type:complete len:142 (+) comp14904_c0_seq9:403-828(+)